MLCDVQMETEQEREEGMLDAAMSEQDSRVQEFSAGKPS